MTFTALKSPSKDRFYMPNKQETSPKNSQSPQRQLENTIEPGMGRLQLQISFSFLRKDRRDVQSRGHQATYSIPWEHYRQKLS